MRAKFSLSLLVFISLFISCNKEVKLTFKEKAITIDTNTIVEINIPQAIGDTDVSKKINTKIEALIMASLQIGEPDSITTTSVVESINNFNKEYNTFKTDFPESPIAWESQIDGEVMYQSDNVITVAITNYQNTGGAHGILIISFLNFDAKTGRELKNDDLFKDTETFKTLAQTYFNKKISDKKETYFEPDNFVLPTNIGFSEDGLILFYNTYEIAPYSSGVTEINIPYEEITHLLNYL